MDVRAEKSWTSAPKSAFSCDPGGGEKLFDPWASGRKGQECPRKTWNKKFMFMLFFFPDKQFPRPPLVGKQNVGNFHFHVLQRHEKPEITQNKFGESPSR